MQERSAHLIPFSSDTARQKEAVELAVATYKHQLDTQLTDLKVNAKKYGKNAAVIAGTLVAVYTTLELLLPEPSEEVPARPKPPTRSSDPDFSISGAIQSMLFTLAMDWGTRKVKEMIQARSVNK
jgi:hypothetical protein